MNMDICSSHAGKSACASFAQDMAEIKNGLSSCSYRFGGEEVVTLRRINLGLVSTEAHTPLQQKSDGDRSKHLKTIQSLLCQSMPYVCVYIYNFIIV